ncbi:unnamed protein product [Schistosoma margrebowiei]|uniref:Uncharacterized protein n=1 Tax=Schistosoma margrebowiei TaxID=48269 RepID=A0A3P8HG71_9TREM|nr:unnamed protein product [Schistosoma margrebowiei]
MTDVFRVKTSVRQACLLFLLVVDWIIKTSTSQGKHRIQWTAWIQTDDLNCQTTKSQSSIRISRQFYCTELRLGELLQLSSRKYKYL